LKDKVGKLDRQVEIDRNRQVVHRGVLAEIVRRVEQDQDRVIMALAEIVRKVALQRVQDLVEMQAELVHRAEQRPDLVMQVNLLHVRKAVDKIVHHQVQVLHVHLNRAS